ncbi:MAG: hypothetical protein CBE20_00465 [Gammaproteobacteria bacterium TMED260]|nr:hypothetical protein [Gammaproteobacteria bacterium]OUX35090.1 MAG: hypothetical protein CBE20_00465 [Gammaproteobacteria bacterium TMED260]
MRYTVVSLILANLAYFGWNYRNPLPESPAVPAQPLINSGLTLVSEFEEQTGFAALEARRQCSLVSGFESADDAENFMAQARTRGFQAFLTGSRATSRSQYQVFLPPTASSEIARLTLADLAQRVVEAGLEVETYLITRGELQNAVALGIFDSATEAVVLRDQFSGLGYSPQIQQFDAFVSRVQVWLRAPESERINELEWLDLTGERPNLSRAENLCQTIAQASQFQ